MFRELLLVSLATLTTLQATGGEQEKNAGLRTMNSHTLNFSQATPQIWVSGQPSKEELIELVANGMTAVINLRPVAEWPFDEAELATNAGLKFHHIPVEGAEGITTANAKRLHTVLASLNNENVLVHCASGNRVGALKALSEALENNTPLDKSIAIGKQWGLTSLEPLVIEKVRQLQEE